MPAPAPLPRPPLKEEADHKGCGGAWRTSRPAHSFYPRGVQGPGRGPVLPKDTKQVRTQPNPESQSSGSRPETLLDFLLSKDRGLRRGLLGLASGK